MSGSWSGRGVLEGAFQVLDALAREPGSGLSAVAAAAELPKATAHRLLEQLCGLGAVERRGTGYQVGYRAYELGRAWQPHPGLAAASRGPARELAWAWGVSAAVCVLRGGRTVVVEGAAGEHGPALAAGCGRPWSTAAGKVILACGQDPDVPATSGWAREAAEIRKRRAAMDQEVLAPGAWCLAVPVRAGGGEVVAAFAALGSVDSPVPPGLEQALHRIGRTLAAALPRR